MRIPRYMTLEGAEARRDAAIGVKGVNYDSRSNRYVVDIMRDGAKRRVGSFLTVQEAAEAYRIECAAFAPARPGRKAQGAKPSISASYAEFLEECGGKPKEGAVWTTPDDQDFFFVKEFWRKTDGNVRNFFYVFEAKCRTEGCQEYYETSVPSYAPHMTGVTRNCDQHRKVHRFARAGNTVSRVKPAGGPGASAARPDPAARVTGAGEVWTETDMLRRVQAHATALGNPIPTDLNELQRARLRAHNASLAPAADSFEDLV